MPTTTEPPYQTTTPEPWPDSLCLTFFIVDANGAKFEEGINGNYKLPNINEEPPFLFRKENAIEDYTFQVLFDGNRWVFQMFLVVDNEVGNVIELILKDNAGNQLTDPDILPLKEQGSFKREDDDILNVIIRENCNGIEDNPPIGKSPSTYQNNFIQQSLLDYTKIPNALPRLTSSNGVEIVSLTSNHVGISFTPKEILSGNLINLNVFGSVFTIDAAYNESEFVVNELRTPSNNSSTVFTFLSALDYPAYTFRSSKIMDGERVRLRSYGYF